MDKIVGVIDNMNNSISGTATVNYTSNNHIASAIELASSITAIEHAYRNF